MALVEYWESQRGFDAWDGMFAFSIFNQNPDRQSVYELIV